MFLRMSKQKKKPVWVYKEYDQSLIATKQETDANVITHPVMFAMLHDLNRLTHSVCFTSYCTHTSLILVFG